MKRFFLLTVLSGLLAGPAFAQDNAVAPSTVELEEKIKRLSSDVETLLGANVQLQKKISELRDEVANLHEKQAKAADDSALQGIREDVRKLADKIQEVDKKRVDDREVVTEQLEKVEKVLKQGITMGAPGTSKTRTPKTDTTPAPVPTGPGFEYVVQSGDTLLGIISKANAQFKEQGMKSVKLQQVLDGNPGLDPNKMKAGQKIFIPAPGK